MLNFPFDYLALSQLVLLLAVEHGREAGQVEGRGRGGQQQQREGRAQAGHGEGGGRTGNERELRTRAEGKKERRQSEGTIQACAGKGERKVMRPDFSFSM